jgi:carbon storage regulator
MLVLTRRVDGSIIIGDPKTPEDCIEVVVVEVRGDQVRLGVTAPKDVMVHRREVYETIQQENRAAAGANPADVPKGLPGRPPRPAA